jgi:hypothetical protein
MPAEKTPKGSNRLARRSAKQSFGERKYYKESAYPDELAETTIGAPEPIDLFHGFQLFGRVDPEQNAIFPGERNLRKVKAASKPNIFALNFVADAFDEMMGYIERAVVTGKICSDGPIAALTTSQGAVKGWNSAIRQYSRHAEVLFTNFADLFMMQHGRNERMTSFDTYLPMLREYFTQVLRRLPVTRTAYITSKFCTPMIGAIAIEVDSGGAKHDSDDVKYEEWISDVNFSFYMLTARKYGFIVDKNAPWRLWADITGETMLGYAAEYGIEEEELFEEYFYRSFETDLDVLRAYVIQFYNAYVANRLDIYKNVGGKCIRITREQITEDQFDKRYGIDYLLGLYFYLRSKESGLNYNSWRLEKEIKKVQSINKYVDTMSALEYINRATRIQFYNESLKFKGAVDAISDY